MNRRVILYLAVGAVSVLLLTGGWFYVTQIRPLGLYREKNKEIAQRLFDLKDQVPAGVNPKQWENLTTLTDIGFGNVFFSPKHASYTEMLRFQADLEEKLRADKPIRVETLRWIWKRLSETGPHGKDYSERMIQLFEEGASQIPAPP